MAKILKIKDIDKCIGCYSCMLACARTVRRSFSPGKAALQIKTGEGFQTKFIAKICRGCIDAPCALACKYDALRVRTGGGIKFNISNCVGCKKCIEACIIQVLNFDSDNNFPQACIQCGNCVKFCPHQVLEMEEHSYG